SVLLVGRTKPPTLRLERRMSINRTGEKGRGPRGARTADRARLVAWAAAVAHGLSKRGSYTGWKLGIIPILVVYTVFFIIPQVIFLRQAFYQDVGPALVGGPFGFSTLEDVFSKPFVRQAL